jgi:succinate dehydrogenase hydrophobic anchor subunit
MIDWRQSVTIMPSFFCARVTALRFTVIYWLYCLYFTVKLMLQDYTALTSIQSEDWLS